MLGSTGARPTQGQPARLGEWGPQEGTAALRRVGTTQ